MFLSSLSYRTDDQYTSAQRETHTLDDIAAEANLEHLENITSERCRTRSHINDLTAQQSSNLSEDQSVIDFVSDFSSVPPVLELRIDGPSEKSTFETSSVHLSFDRRVDSVPDSRDTGHHVWLDDLSVFKQSCIVACGEADDAIHVHDQKLKEALVADVS